VRDAVAAWLITEKKWELCCLPVVAETWDGELNDINGLHVRIEHVRNAIRTASAGMVAEGTWVVALGWWLSVSKAAQAPRLAS